MKTELEFLAELKNKINSVTKDEMFETLHDMVLTRIRELIGDDE